MNSVANTGQIRLVTEADAAFVQSIYEPYVQHTVISFELTPPTVDEMRTRIQKTLQTHPWLIYKTGGEIAGYAYASKHRERLAYQWSVDVTVYVSGDFHRLGIGRGLYTSLFALLSLQGYYSAFAGIALPNEKSIGLHTAMGFESVGVYPQVGYKLGQWHDVSWWSLSLLPHSDTPESPKCLSEIRSNPGYEAALSSGLAFIRQK